MQTSDRRVQVAAAFSDPGRLDTHTAFVRWGDGTQSAARVSERDGIGAAVADHQYATNGPYTVTITVRDDDGGETSVERRVGGGGSAAGPAKASFAGSKSSIRVDRNRRFAFSFRAGRGLTGSAVFRSVKKVRVSRKARVRLATKRFRVGSSGRVKLRIRLSKKHLRTLRLNRSIRVRVTVTLENSAGLTSTASKTITLKPPKPKRRRG